MKCIYCGAEIPDNAIFCPNCGGNLSNVKHCPKCGEAVCDDERFCHNCGAELLKPATLPKEEHDEEEHAEPKKSELPTPEIQTDNDTVLSDLEEYEEEDGRSHKWIYTFAIISIPLIIGAGVWCYNTCYNKPDKIDPQVSSVVGDSLSVSNTENDSLHLEQEEENKENAQKHTTEYLSERVSQIYTQAINSGGGSADEAFLTMRFIKIIKAINVIQETKCISLNEFDHWYWGNEERPSNLQVDQVDIKDQYNATVDITLSFPSETPNIRLKLLFENNDWFIDDFQEIKKGKIIFSNRKYLEEAISSN